MPFFILYLFFCRIYSMEAGEGQQRAAELWQASPSALPGENWGAGWWGLCFSCRMCVSGGLTPEPDVGPPFAPQQLQGLL